MITSELFGTAPCGTPVHRYTLNGPEICVRIMDYGATVLGIDVPDIPGNVRDVVLGFDKLEDYFDNPACFGATIGPVANRTAGATITIDGTDWHMPANEGANNLHSDLEHGLHKRVWDVELDEVHNAVHMTTSLKASWACPATEPLQPCLPLRAPASSASSMAARATAPPTCP